jgi:hypothetical protein
MAATQQTQAIQDANTIIALGGQLLSLYNAIVAANQSWQDHTSLTVLNAMGTVAQNPDGTLGTADGSASHHASAQHGDLYDLAARGFRDRYLKRPDTAKQCGELHQRRCS